MILHRIIGHLKTQNWNAIAIEFVIVTAGVLMGIQVSNWNDDRLEKARIQQQLASLRTELEGNRTKIKEYQAHIGTQLRDIQELERGFDRPDGTAGIDRKLINIFRVRSLLLETSAYDELTDSGSIRHVNPDVRSGITEWAAGKGLVERVDQDALAFRIGAVDHLFSALAFEPMAASLAPSFKPAGRAPLRNDLARLTTDIKVRNYLAMRYVIENQKLQFSKDLERSTEELIALLGKD